MARIPIIVKFDKIKERGSIPTSWNDIKFKDYIKYLRASEKGSIEGIYEALTGISTKMWGNPHKPELFANIDKRLKFTQLEPNCELPTHIERAGEFYPISKDFLKLPLGKYRDIITTVSEVMSDEDADDIDQIASMSKMIAVFVLQDFDKIEEYSKEIDEMPCDVVYTLGCFFLQKLTALSNGTSEKQPIQKLLANKLKQVMRTLVAYLIICITFIRYPKVIISSLKKFGSHLLVRFTGGRSYKVISMQQIKDTNKF